MSNIIPFNFKDQNIRVIQDNNGEPLFVAKDVALALGYKNTKQAVIDHCRKPKSLKDIEVVIHDPLDSKTKLITESDLYRLTMKSQLESAEIFQDWVCEDVLPSIRKTGAYSSPQQPQEIKPIIEANKLFKSNLSIAKTIFKGNQAILSANQATRKMTDIDVLDNLGATALLSETTQALLTASDIGKQIGLSGMKVNLLLEQKGLLRGFRDAKQRQQWEMTEEGEKVGQALDTGKRHGDGTPVKQNKWYSKVIQIVDAKVA